MRVKILASSVLSLLIYFVIIPPSDANTAAQCVQFGVNGHVYGWNLAYPDRPGYWTIGTKEFDNKWIGSLGTRYSWHGNVNNTFKPGTADKPCPWEWQFCTDTLKVDCMYKQIRIEPCVDNSYVQMRMYLVKQEGRVLQGWLHVEIEMMDETDTIELIYIQMRDESFNAIGEFVHAHDYPGAVCQPSKSSFSTPTRYQFYPCSATGLREAKTSQAVMMARAEDYVNDEVKKLGYIHQTSIERGVHFLWKMDEYWCSRHQKIQPYAYILTKRNQESFLRMGKKEGGPDPLMLRKIPSYWIHPKWFGASDILNKHGKLDCSELAIDDMTGEITSAAKDSWIDDSSPVLLKEDSWYPPSRYEVFDLNNKSTSYYGTRLCQADPIHQSQKESTVPVFSGRCKHHFQKAVSPQYFQGCNLDTTSIEFSALDLNNFQNYSKYNGEKKSNRLELCVNAQSCRAPKTSEDFEAMKVFPPEKHAKAEVVKVTVGVDDERTKAKIAKFWVGRKYHGILCSVAAMFVTPVYIFLARYYKETCMQRDSCWFTVHLGGVIAVAALFTSSYTALTPNFPVWGRSLHDAAKVHRIMGHLSGLLYIQLVLLGGCRAGIKYEEGKCLRQMTVVMHSALGFLHQIVNMLAIMTSSGIPLSPTLKECDHKHGLPSGLGLVIFLAVGSMAVDLIFHVILSVLQCMTDKIHSVKRGWWCPIIPIMPSNSITDFQGSGVRKAVLIAYLIITLGLSFGAVALIIGAKVPKHCRIGPMSCKHLFGCSETAIQYETWFIKQGGVVENI